MYQNQCNHAQGSRAQKHNRDLKCVNQRCFDEKSWSLSNIPLIYNNREQRSNYTQPHLLQKTCPVLLNLTTNNSSHLLQHTHLFFPNVISEHKPM